MLKANRETAFQKIRIVGKLLSRSFSYHFHGYFMLHFFVKVNNGGVVTYKLDVTYGDFLTVYRDAFLSQGVSDLGVSHPTENLTAFTGFGSDSYHCVTDLSSNSFCICFDFFGFVGRLFKVFSQDLLIGSGC